MSVNGILVSNHVNRREVSLKTLDVMNECLLRNRQMDGAIRALLDDRNMHPCVAVLDGEWGGINGAKVGNIVRQINYGLSGLDERKANDSVNCQVRSCGNDNAYRGPLLHEVRQVEVEPYRQFGGNGFPLVLDNT
jgi:hypothetical protein